MKMRNDVAANGHDGISWGQAGGDGSNGADGTDGLDGTDGKYGLFSAGKR